MRARLPEGYGKVDRKSIMEKYQKMQEEMQSLTEDLEAREHTVTAGGGQVSLTMNGKYEVSGVTIKPEVVDPNDIEMLEDLLAAAVNEGVRVVRETQEKEMNQLTGSFDMPANLGL